MATKILTIGIITYGKLTARYLPYFFSSLEKQNFKNFKVLFFDNSENNELENREFILQKIKEEKIDIELNFCDKNLGFAKAYNKMIKKAIVDDSKYFLAINLDMILDEKAIQKMIKYLEENNKLGSVCPKIYQWDFENNKKTKIIDTCGIKEIKPLRFIDVGQGKIDDGQFNDVEIFGPSGAVAMYKISALEKIKQNEQYFDEKMFMYKEDCDLAYRLYLAGFKSKCVIDSICYHDRTASCCGVNCLSVAKNRKNKSKQVRIWSFRNQQIIFFKYWKKQSLKNKISILFYEIQIFIFILFFERYLLKEFLDVYKNK